MDILRLCFTNNVGEDIELCNGSLGHAVRSKRGQSDLDHLQNSYLRLGVMLRHKKIAKIKSYAILELSLVGRKVNV